MRLQCTCGLIESIRRAEWNFSVASASPLGWNFLLRFEASDECVLEREEGGCARKSINHSYYKRHRLCLWPNNEIPILKNVRIIDIHQLSTADFSISCIALWKWTIGRMLLINV